nr:hypothetical protein [Tanacetum cinerariifolium]
MLGQQLEVEGDGNENVPLYYYITDNIIIQFGREEFCLVTGLRFGVENLADYDDIELCIPFRRRVFLSYLDEEHITGNNVFKIIDDELFDRLHDDDIVSFCCLGILQLILLGVEGKRRIPDWMLRLANDRTWILESFRVTTTRYYNRYNRYPRVAAWKKGKFMGTMVHGFFLVRQANKGPIIVSQHYGISGLSEFSSMQNIPIQGKRKQRPSFYKWSPYMEQPPSTVLPNKHGNKTKNNVEKYNLSHLNLVNVLDDDNEGGDDVIFLGGQFTDFDSNTPVVWLSGGHMNSWMELLIRNRPNNAPWTVAYTNTISVHPKNQRFLIETDQHAIGTLDGSTRPYLAWNDVN